MNRMLSRFKNDRTTHSTVTYVFMTVLLLYVESSNADKDESLKYFIQPPNWRTDLLKIPTVLMPNLDDAVFKHPQLRLVIFVTTLPHKYVHRRAVRNTLGKWAKGLHQKLLFLTGRLPDNSSSAAQVLLQLEANLYGDIIQYDFKEDYHNLSQKSLLMLRFFNEHILDLSSDSVHFGRSAKPDNFSVLNRQLYFLKTDDDAFVHLGKVLKAIKKSKTIPKSLQGALYGTYNHGMGIIRQKGDRLYVPPELWPGKTFPDYTAGAAYFMSAYVARSIFLTALFTENCRYFPIEDVYITGYCASKAAKLIDDYTYSEQLLDIKPKQVDGDVKYFDFFVSNTTYQKKGSFYALLDLRKDEDFTYVWKTVQLNPLWKSKRNS